MILQVKIEYLVQIVMGMTNPKIKTANKSAMEVKTFN